MSDGYLAQGTFTFPQRPLADFAPVLALGHPRYGPLVRAAAPGQGPADWLALWHADRLNQMLGILAPGSDCQWEAGAPSRVGTLWFRAMAKSSEVCDLLDLVADCIPNQAFEGRGTLVSSEDRGAFFYEPGRNRFTVEWI